MNSEDIQKILDGFVSSDIGKADDFKLASFRNRRLVYQYDMNGNLIKIHKSISDAAKSVNRPSNNLIDALNGMDYNEVPVYQLGGYIWRYKETQFTEEELDLIRTSTSLRIAKKEINVFNDQGIFINSYKGPCDASENIFPGDKNSRRMIERIVKEERSSLYRNLIFTYEKEISKEKLNEILNSLEPVACYGKNGKLIEKYDSILEAAESYKTMPANIRIACNELNILHKEVFWRFVTEEKIDDKIELLPNGLKKVTNVYDANKKLLGTYVSTTEAAKSVNITNRERHKSITASLRARIKGNRHPICFVDGYWFELIHPKN